MLTANNNNKLFRTILLEIISKSVQVQSHDPSLAKSTKTPTH